jgi:hypothetical protein
MSKLYLLKKTKHLPPGHIDKKRAEDAVISEYRKCSEIAFKWRKRFDLKIQSPAHALRFCNEICDMLGEPRLKEIVVNSSEVDECAGAHYSNRSIHFKWDWIYFPTLMHELAHHFSKWSGHGPDYCNALDFLFKVAYTYVTGKQPKKDW